MSKYNELVKKLKEIFQIDKPELDFGIYRILNAKADEINNYLENTLKKKISDALASAGNANKEELERQLAEAIKNAEGAGFNPDDSPKVKDLRAQIAASSQGANEHENAVFTHLLTFFSRYYDSGDFVSKRRYKGDTYAIPYAGEEVMLHWANKDQYYIKSGENFSNYSFKLEDGRKVTFKLLAADTAKDNRKDNDADRRFVLVEQHTRIKYDDDGLDYEEEVLPVFVDSSGEQDELVIQFEYKAVKKGTKQEALVSQALDAILSNSNIQSDWVDVTKREPTEKNPNRTLLEKHLTTYTQRNTADYFIHKDLGCFLSNELDFYIKNEVMNLDNVQNAEVFSDIEKQLRMIQCLRSISADIIKFLAQLENFQKKLWDKRKFVIKSDYLVSISEIPNSMYDKISESHEQWDHWHSLGFIKEIPKAIDLKRQLLTDTPQLVVNTAYLARELKDDLVSKLTCIDTLLTGEMFCSDNYHSLRLLERKYANKVDLTYIDPPYNTGGDGFLYKDNYKSSSWNSMFYERLLCQNKLQKKGAALTVSLDDNQIDEAKMILKGSQVLVNTIAVKTKVSGVSGSHHGKSLKNAMEYLLLATNSVEDFKLTPHVYDSFELISYIENMESEGKSWKYVQVMVSPGEREEVGSFLDGYGQEIKIYSHTGPVFKSIKSIADEDFSGNIKDAYYAYIDQVFDTQPAQSSIRTRVIEASKDLDCDLISISYIPTAGRNKGNVIDLYYKGASRRLVTWLKDITTKEDGIIYKKENSGNFWSDIRYNNLAKEGNTVFPNGKKPLSLVSKCIDMTLEEEGVVLDYFAGSGTTAHAVLNKNRELASSNFKFLTMEQQEYFDTKTVPRIEKVMFDPDWTKGVPLRESEHTPSIVKVNYLESYEDSLNNLELRKPQTTGDLFDSMPEQAKSDYLLNYMLETESKGSLLSTDDFKKPFDYKMKIAVDSAGAFEERNIDLVETFNYLVGLHVNTVESNIERGYVRVEGNLPSGEKALVLWRDCEKIGYDDFTKFANRFDLFAKEKTFDVIYVNGDHNLPTAFTSDEGEVTRTLKLRQIEPEFLELMFAPDELA